MIISKIKSSNKKVDDASAFINLFVLTEVIKIIYLKGIKTLLNNCCCTTFNEGFQVFKRGDDRLTPLGIFHKLNSSFKSPSRSIIYYILSFLKRQNSMS